MHGLQPCGALVVCGRRLFLQAISPPFLVVSSSTKKHDVGRVFLMCAKFFAHICAIYFKNRTWSLSSALDAFSCKQSLIFACRLNYPAKLHAATACRFLCAFRTPLQKLCRRVRRLRSRLPLASNFSLFTCRQQLILSAFIDVNFGESVVCFGFFNLKISWIFL